LQECIVPGGNRTHVLEPEGEGKALDGSDRINDAAILIEDASATFRFTCCVAILDWVDHPFGEYINRYLKI
jgi:hypothetical protein